MLEGKNCQPRQRRAGKRVYQRAVVVLLHDAEAFVAVAQTQHDAAEPRVVKDQIAAAPHDVHRHLLVAAQPEDAPECLRGAHIHQMIRFAAYPERGQAVQLRAARYVVLAGNGA